MKTFALLSLPLLLAACATTAMPAGALPEGPARIGQTVSVGGPTVRPLAVIEDSRCPVNVTCVWAGRLVVRAVIGTGRGRQRMELTLGTPVPVADGVLTLTHVTPDSFQGKVTRRKDYRFTFEFAGGL